VWACLRQRWRTCRNSRFLAVPSALLRAVSPRYARYERLGVTRELVGTSETRALRDTAFLSARWAGMVEGTLSHGLRRGLHSFAAPRLDQ